ncbi:ribonuclease H-like domain-containing protein [Tanacetum coccineum]
MGYLHEVICVEYSTSSKAFRVYNKRTKRVEENLHINFLEDQPNVTRTGPNWMFDLDFLTNSMNYIPVSVENQVNVDAGTQDSYVAGSSGKDKGPTQEYILLPLQPHRTKILVEDVPLTAHEKPSESSSKDNNVQDTKDAADKEEKHQMKESEQDLQDELEKMKASSGYQPFVSTDRPSVSIASTPTGTNADASDTLPNDGIFNGAYDDDEDVGAVADFNNMDNTIVVSPIPTLRIHKDHPKGQILGDPTSAVQTRGKIQKASSAQQALNMLPAANVVRQSIWIQNQMMDLGFYFLLTPIHIDNESTISVIKNPVAHSRTKHIEIRFHFIRDCYEKRLRAYLEKTDGNTEFHQIMDFLTRSSIYYALTLKDVPVPLDHFPVPTLTKKVLTFMVKKGKNFLGKVTPLFDSMLVQQIEDEAIPYSNPKGSGRNHGGQSSSDRSLFRNEDCLTLQSVVKEVKKGVKPLITHHKAWMKSVALKTRLARKTYLMKKGVQKEYVSKQGRKSVKSSKGEPSVHKDPAFV